MGSTVLPYTEIVEVVHIALALPVFSAKQKLGQDIGRGICIQLPFHKYMAGKGVAAHQSSQPPLAQGGIRADNLGDKLQDQVLPPPFSRMSRLDLPAGQKSGCLNPPLFAVTNVVQTYG